MKTSRSAVHDLAYYEARSEKVPWSGCWIWMRATRGGRSPYGWMGHRGRSITAHRGAYRDLVGPIPPGLMICHHCDVHQCINPAHLFAGTNADNMRDMARKGRINLPHTVGETHPCAKLTNAQVLEIRARLSGGENWKALAREFNVNKYTIRTIGTRERWSHL